ncbi:hypothetical protein LIER_12589 [Lithospermum erythrorhizon]|uniref:Uncharacterized protein n=1 Tax=Lithospermum erythrorhizon TaxID=34254 RepID=A0AAV3PXJ0_LITER
MEIQPMERQMKDWSLPGVVDSPSCIVLYEVTKNYELNSWHHYKGRAHGEKEAIPEEEQTEEVVKPYVPPVPFLKWLLRSKHNKSFS